MWLCVTTAAQFLLSACNSLIPIPWRHGTPIPFSDIFSTCIILIHAIILDTPTTHNQRFILNGERKQRKPNKQRERASLERGCMGWGWGCLREELSTEA